MNSFVDDAKKQAEHLQSLGSKSKRDISTPSVEILEVFPNSNPERNYVIELVSSEFSSLCPKTKQPDYASIILRYIADQHCIESKSWKELIFSFRNTGAFMERITNHILSMLVEACSPRGMVVTCQFNARGGITTDVVVDYLNSELPEAIKMEVADKLDIPYFPALLEATHVSGMVIDAGIADKLDKITTLLGEVLTRLEVK